MQICQNTPHRWFVERSDIYFAALLCNVCSYVCLCDQWTNTLAADIIILRLHSNK